MRSISNFLLNPREHSFFWFRVPFAFRVMFYFVSIGFVRNLIYLVSSITSGFDSPPFFPLQFLLLLCNVSECYIQLALPASILLGVLATLNLRVLWLYYLGRKYLKQERWTNARDVFEEAYKYPEVEKWTGRQQKIASGLVEEHLGHFTKALIFYNEALKYNDTKTRAAIFTVGVSGLSWLVGGKNDNLLRIGLLYLKLGQPSKALEKFNAVKAATDNHNPFTAMSAANYIGLYYLQAQEYEFALKHFQDAKTLYRSMQRPRAKQIEYGEVLLNWSSVYLQQALETNASSQARELCKEAREVCEEASRIAQQHSNRYLECLVHLNFGCIDAALGENLIAEEKYNEALKIAKELKSLPIEAKILHHLGEVLARRGNLEQAAQCLYQAIDILDSLRDPHLEIAYKLSLFETQTNTYQLLLKVLIDLDRKAEALVVAERAQARALIDLLTRSSSDQLQQTEMPKAVTLQDIYDIAKLQEATLVKYFFVTDLELYIWVVQPDGDQVGFAQSSINVLEDILAQLERRTLQQEGDDCRSETDESPSEVLVRSIRDAFRETRKVRPRSRLTWLESPELYNLLIHPITKWLPSHEEEKVIFIPHKTLFRLPFAGLKFPDGEHLIDKHTILMSPSIQLLKLTHERQQERNSRDERLDSLPPQDKLIVGNPTMPSSGSPPKPLPSLEHAEREVNDIARLVGTQAITGSQATKGFVIQRMQNTRLIHFATHASLEYGTSAEPDIIDFPGRIALAPSGIPTEPDDGFLKASEIMVQETDADLVVLSCCETGDGYITGDGVIGLSYAFMTIRVPSIVVTLLEVNDESTAELMVCFYRHYLQSYNKAKALRAAMQETKQQERFHDPGYWSAFVLIGEAQ